MLAVKSGFILFIKSYQFLLQMNTLEREREREYIEMVSVDLAEQIFFRFFMFIMNR